MLDRQADIVVRASSGAVLALVEVKNLPRIDPSDAAALRDAMVPEGPAGGPRYVVVVTQRRGFIWTPGAGDEWTAQPEQFDMTPILREYLAEADLERHMRGMELEIIIAHWLAELARGRPFHAALAENDGVIAKFVADIRGAQVEFGALT